MDTKDLINFKKQRIEEEIQKIIPPGFSWSAYPTEKERQKYSPNRSVAEENWREFLGQDLDLIMQVGYIKPTNPEYAKAIGNLRYFGGKLSNYKDFINSGPFFKDPEGSKNFEEACDYIVRFYDLTKIIVRRVEEEQKVSIRRKDLKEKKENQSSEKKKKATKFVSGATNFRPGKRVTIKSTKVSGIIPKKPIPSAIVDKISKPVEESNVEDSIDAPKKVVSVFGKLTLDLVQINDNLDKIREIIVEDYKRTKEKNKEETKDFRKRVAERSKKIGKRELGDNKKDLKGIVKKYTGSFFSGTGGAIRALSLFKMVEALVNGNPIDALGPLLGIGATYLPAIAQAIGGIIAAKVIGGIFKPGRGVPRRGTPRRGVPGRGISRLGKYGKLIALGTGALSLGGAYIASSKLKGQEQRLEDLKEDQKEKKEDIKSKDSQSPKNLIPQKDLDKFEDLNNKFQKILDFLIKDKEGKVKQSRQNRRSEEPSEDQYDSSLRGTVTGGRFNIPKTVSLLKSQGATDDEAIKLAAISKYESGGDPNIDTVKSGLDPSKKNEYSIGLFQINWKAHKGWLSKMGITDENQLRDPVTNAQAALKLYRDTGPTSWSAYNNKVKSSDLKVARRSLNNNSGTSDGSNKPNLSSDSLVRTRSPEIRTNVETPPSSRMSPVILPLPIQQQSEKLPASTTDAGNLVVNNVSTTYSDNYYALYSKLIYQIV